MAKRNGEELDLCNSPVVVAIDPGGTTGWSIIQVHPESLVDDEVLVLDNIDFWHCGQFTGNENAQAKEVLELIASWPGCATVMEDFILRMMNADREVLSPVRIISKIEYGLWLQGGSFFLQQPSEAKTTATDARLKSWKLYKAGEEHARDGTRHAITFLRKAKERESLRMYAWPHIYGVDMPYGPTSEEIAEREAELEAEKQAKKLARIG